MPFKVGLTGGVASGKSTVANLFSELGVAVIDADIIAKRLLDKDTIYYQKVIDTFGKSILNDGGEINRSTLRERIFNDKQAKQMLENILHPPIHQQLLLESSRCDSAYVLLVIPLLAEANMQSLVDRTLVIDCPAELQVSRLMERDGISQELALAMLNNQLSREARIAIADDIISNHKEKNTLTEQVKHLHQCYLKQAQSHN
jgi:dephospho-CoA kinase